MATEQDFDRLVGATIRFCQCIENDIKMIYAGMLSGNFDDNYRTIKKSTLGTTVGKLQELDNSDGKPYFAPNDYTLLREITEIRNYWAHQGYLDYVYDLSMFSNQYNRISNDSQRLKGLHESTQEIRLNFFGYTSDDADID